MRAVNKLSAARIAKITDTGRYSDGNGLYLQVSKWGTKSWVLRYMLNRKARTMGLGPLRKVTLQQARERAREEQFKVVSDIDPVKARKDLRLAAEAEAAAAITFRQAAEAYIAANRAGWRSDKHALQWETLLATFVHPVIGDLPVSAISTAHVSKILDPIWTTKTETASRIRGRIEKILDWAKVKGYRSGDNPARGRGHIDKLLPAKKKVVGEVKHLDALPYDEAPGFMGDLRQRDSITARALEFTILTAVRTNEALGAKWSEVDFNAKVWTIPAERTKMNRPHRVPLSDRVLAILGALPLLDVEAGYLFPSPTRRGEHLGAKMMAKMLHAMKKVATVHGFRSTFRDWCGENSTFPREVAEAALAHAVGNAVEQAYRRGDALEKRRKLMQAWASFCTGSVVVGKVGNVRNIGSAAVG